MKSPYEIYLLSGGIKEFAPLSIHISYRLFIDFFLGELSEEKVLQGAYMVYGWMPTMLKLKGPKENIYELVLAARAKNLDVELLSKCAQSLNNSLVGTTKLLHFVSPEKYPIWDSRVYRALFGKTPHTYRVEDPNVYIEYIHWTHEFQKLGGFAMLKDRFEAEAGYGVSSMRVTEATLYSLGPRPKKNKKV